MALHTAQCFNIMPAMAKESVPRRTFLREWREYRGMKQDDVIAALAEIPGKMPRTPASLSRIENGRQPYSPEILEALATIYNTKAGRLIDLNPQVGGQLHHADEFRALPEKVQIAIKAVLDASELDVPE